MTKNQLRNAVAKTNKIVLMFNSSNSKEVANLNKTASSIYRSIGPTPKFKSFLVPPVFLKEPVPLTRTVDRYFFKSGITGPVKRIDVNPGTNYQVVFSLALRKCKQQPNYLIHYKTTAKNGK